MKKVITIDGPSGAGKSTVAKRIAEKLGFQYLDTGALYRAVALYLRRKKLSEDATDKEIADALEGLNLSFRDGRTYINGEDVSTEIRTPDVGHYSSVFSARKVVRDYLLGMQRAFPEGDDTVCEGRDMGTVVFPGAWRKFFLDASEEERAKRRYEQLTRAGKSISYEDALRDVRERDRRDSSRDIAPLKKPEDAIYIDTTNLELEEVISKVLSHL